MVAVALRDYYPCYELWVDGVKKKTMYLNFGYPLTYTQIRDIEEGFRQAYG